MALRALQGFFECTISPGFLLVIGSWYRTEEQAARALFFQSANAFFLIVCDLIMYGIAGYVTKHGGIQPWRTISLFLGDRAIDNSNWGSEALSDLRERWKSPFGLCTMDCFSFKISTQSSLDFFEFFRVTYLLFYFLFYHVFILK